MIEKKKAILGAYALLFGFYIGMLIGDYLLERNKRESVLLIVITQAL